MDVFKNLQLLGNRAAVVVSRAGNRSLQGAKTDAAKFIPQNYNVKAVAVRKHIKIKKMKASFLTGDAIFKHGEGLPLILFKPKPKTPSIGPGSRKLPDGQWRAPLRGGASAEVKKGGRKKIKTAFIFKAKSGHIGVATKSDRKKSGGTSDNRSFHYIIEQRYGPSISQMVENIIIMREIKVGMERRYKKELPRQIRHEARKLGIKIN